MVSFTKEALESDPNIYERFQEEILKEAVKFLKKKAEAEKKATQQPPVSEEVSLKFLPKTC